MNHPELAALLDYVADRASQDAALDVAEHIAECDSCLASVQALSLLRAQNIPPSPLSPIVEATLKYP